MLSSGRWQWGRCRALRGCRRTSSARRGGEVGEVELRRGLEE